MPVSLTRVFNPNPGWYRGDFHTHSTCSDGSFSPRGLSDLALQQGLDFLAITDHNDIRAFDDFDPSFERMILPGVEVTLFEGHFNVFGFAGNTAEAREVFRSIVDVPRRMMYNLSKEHSALNDLMERISVAGYLISLNHPLLKPWEWRDPRTNVAWFEGIELVNDPTYDDNYLMNPAARRLWSAWLNAGYRCTGLGGSDFHSLTPSDNRNRSARLNLPLTYVFAEELSCLAILDGVRRRRAYVSMGPQIELRAEVDGQNFMIGDDLGENRAPARLTARVRGCSGKAEAILVRNGQALARKDVVDGAAELEVELPAWGTLSPSARLGGSAPQEWYRFDVIDAADQALAISNPIYIGPRRSPPASKFGDYAGKYPAI